MSLLMFSMGFVVGLYVGVIVAGRDITRMSSLRPGREPMPLKVWRRD
jgi:hypothetical protein